MKENDKILKSGTYFIMDISKEQQTLLSQYQTPLHFMEKLLEDGSIKLLEDERIREELIREYISQNNLSVEQITYIRKFRLITENEDVRFIDLQKALTFFEKLMDKGFKNIKLYEEIWFENDLLISDYLVGIGNYPLVNSI